MKKNYYAVKVGRQCNVIVMTWTECEELVRGVSCAEFKGFKFEFQAEEYLKLPPLKVRKAINTPVPEKLEVADPPKLCQKRMIFIPATDKRDKFGFYKPRYYQYAGVTMADYGRTIGENCDINNLYSGAEAPWH